LSTKAKVGFFHIFGQNGRKTSKIRVNPGLGAVNTTAPGLFFHFRHRKNPEKAGVLLCGLCSAKKLSNDRVMGVEAEEFGKRPL
jgi:hypothetical protein